MAFPSHKHILLGKFDRINITCSMSEKFPKNFQIETAHIIPILRYRGSYMSVRVLLNLLKELRKRNKIRGLPRFFFSF